MAEAGRRGTEVLLLLEVEVAVDWILEDVLKARWVIGPVWKVGMNAPTKNGRSRR